MKKTTKVTLLSLLVFPGVGHLFLKKYAVAVAFIASFSYLIMGLLYETYEKVEKIIDRIMEGEIPMDVAHINRALIDSEVLSNSNMPIMSYILFFIWILAAFDANRIANKG